MTYLLSKSAQPFSSFSETNEQQFIFIYIDNVALLTKNITFNFLGKCIKSKLVKKHRIRKKVEGVVISSQNLV